MTLDCCVSLLVGSKEPGQATVIFPKSLADKKKQSLRL